MTNDIDLGKSIDDTPLGFGKYARLTPRLIFDRDPAYLVWMWETFEIPPLSRELYEQAVADTLFGSGDGDDAAAPDAGDTEGDSLLKPVDSFMRDRDH